MYLIHKHKNRKLYDTTKHVNITLREVFELFKSGTEFKVINSENSRERPGEDVTDDTILQSFTQIPTPKVKRKLLDYARQGL